jgi:transcriptional regulator with XRE-family HTH domain
LEYISIMKESTLDLNLRLAARIRELRATRGLSLDTLAERSAVSRSMISLIERGEANPTAVVLDKLASALGVTLATLFAEIDSAAAISNPLSKRLDQTVWTDPASGYKRRVLTPPNTQQEFQLVEITFPAGARVAFDLPMPRTSYCQQLWMVEGSMQITANGQQYCLEKGDCLALTLNTPTHYVNPGNKTARYLLLMPVKL